jgi:Reverse transcriptase (RNA-dependent DNA polymerase)
MFLKQKRSGIIKSRLVAGGHMQDKSLYSVMNTSSPTVSTDALLILLAIFANKRSKIITIDIVSAYLNCDIQKQVYMSLDKLMVGLLIKLDTTYEQYVNKENGSVHVKLKKALYGLI